MDHVICHFEIPADEPEALAKFYTQLFGWKIEKMPGFPDYYGIRPSADEQALGGGMMKRQSPQQGPINYVLVESVSDYLRKAESLGAMTVVPKTEIPGMGWFALILDPQHNPFGLFESAPK